MRLLRRPLSPGIRGQNDLEGPLELNAANSVWKPSFEADPHRNQDIHPAASRAGRGMPDTMPTRGWATASDNPTALFSPIHRTKRTARTLATLFRHSRHFPTLHHPTPVPTIAKTFRAAHFVIC